MRTRVVNCVVNSVIVKALGLGALSSGSSAGAFGGVTSICDTLVTSTPMRESTSEEAIRIGTTT